MVQKLHFGEWVDWVYITQSTIPGAGRGIFAARNFQAGEFIGRYLGRLLGLNAELTDAVLKVRAPVHKTAWSSQSSGPALPCPFLVV